MAESKDKVKPNTYVIPRNFIDSDYFFGGRFKRRNFIEGVVLALPVVVVFALGWKFWGWSIIKTVAYFIILTAGIFMLGVNGISDDSFIEYLQRVKKFKTNRQTAHYNFRVKLEAKPDYLMVDKSSLPREKLAALVGKLSNAIIGDDTAPISPDIHDEKLVVFFRDDEGYVEKPDALKSKEELRKDAKERKRLAKEKAKEEKAYIATLPKAERATKRQELKLKAKAEMEEKKRVEIEERMKNDELVRIALEKAEAAKRAAYLKEKEQREALKAAQKAEKTAKKARGAHGKHAAPVAANGTGNTNPASSPEKAPAAQPEAEVVEFRPVRFSENESASEPEPSKTDDAAVIPFGGMTDDVNE